MAERPCPHGTFPDDERPQPVLTWPDSGSGGESDLAQPEVGSGGSTPSSEGSVDYWTLVTPSSSFFIENSGALATPPRIAHPNMQESHPTSPVSSPTSKRRPRRASLASETPTLGTSSTPNPRSNPGSPQVAGASRGAVTPARPSHVDASVQLSPPPSATLPQSGTRVFELTSGSRAIHAYIDGDDPMVGHWYVVTVGRKVGVFSSL